MCLGLAGRVLALTDHRDLAEVDVAGVVRPINIGLLDEPLAPGQWVLVHSGFALELMSAEQAGDAMAVLGGSGPKELGEDG